MGKTHENEANSKKGGMGFMKGVHQPGLRALLMRSLTDCENFLSVVILDSSFVSFFVLCAKELTWLDY